MQGSLLPGFTPEGLLPPGDYPLTLDELAHSILVVGPSPAIPDWDTSWRQQLVNNLAILVNQLRQVGIMDIFIDGSFVESKPRPGDIDGYYLVEPAIYIQRQRPLLHTINPLLAEVENQATWVYAPEKGEPRPQLYHVYHVELFRVVNSPLSNRPGQLPHFFRYARQGQPKGIVGLVA